MQKNAIGTFRKTSIHMPQYLTGLVFVQCSMVVLEKASFCNTVIKQTPMETPSGRVI